MLNANDGFVRLTLDEVLSLPLTHLVSGLDEHGDEAGCGGATTISGYTEWVSRGGLAVTVGWDWVLYTAGDHLRWRRVGLPRSNLLLVDPTRHDYPWERNLSALATVVDAMPWQEQARSAITTRYA